MKYNANFLMKIILISFISFVLLFSWLKCIHQVYDRDCLTVIFFNPGWLKLVPYLYFLHTHDEHLDALGQEHLLLAMVSWVVGRVETDAFEWVVVLDADGEDYRLQIFILIVRQSIIHCCTKVFISTQIIWNLDHGWPICTLVEC